MKETAPRSNTKAMAGRRKPSIMPRNMPEPVEEAVMRVATTQAREASVMPRAERLRRDTRRGSSIVFEGALGGLTASS